LTALNLALGSRLLSIVSNLASKTIMDDWVDPEPLHSSAQAGDLARVRELVEQGVPINAFDDLGKTPLHDAAREEHDDVSLLLIRSGANVNAHDERVIGDTPLGEVAGNCTLRMARLLVDAGADPTIPGWMQLTALDRAKERKRGDGPQVDDLLRSRARRSSES
jgi:ankyrin repeat protein